MARANRTRFAILGTLTLGPQSGYDIKQFASEVLVFFWSESYGQIYPTLAELEREGLCDSKSVRTDSRLERKVYRITQQGRAAFEAWLAEPVPAQPVRNELLLKVFFSHNSPVPQTLAHLEKHRDAQRGMAAFLHEQEQALKKDVTDSRYPYWLSALRLGQYISEARASWAEETMAMLSKLPGARAARHTKRSTTRRPTSSRTGKKL